MLKPADKTKSVGRNAVVLVMAQFSGTLVAFLLTPFIIHSLGIHLFGIWVFVGSIVAFIGLFNLSLGRSTVRFGAVYGERGDDMTIRRIVSYGVASHLVFGLALALLAWFAVQLVPHTTIPPDEAALAERLLLLGYLAGVLRSTVRPIGGLLMGLERLWLTSLFVLVSQAAYALTMLVLLSAGSGIYGLVLAALSLAFFIVLLVLLRAVRFFDTQDLRVMERVLPARWRALARRPAVEFLFGVRCT